MALIPLHRKPSLNERARNVFKRIYHNRRIDVYASKETLNDQLNLYLDHLTEHLSKQIKESDRKRIEQIIKRNDDVASILNSFEYRQTVAQKRNLLGTVSVGMVFCIDGRIPTIFLGGRFASHWEVPAGEIVATPRLSDKKLIPQSADLGEALRNLVTHERDLLEIVFAHTSLIDPHHGCGAMAAKSKAGILDPKMTLEDANLEIIEQKTIPAITNLFNDFRKQKGLEPLKQVGVSALYDTDSFGIILNHEQREKDNSLSSTELGKEFKDEMDDFFIKDSIVYGAFSKKFTDLKYLHIFSEKLYFVLSALLDQAKFPKLNKKIDSFLEKNYSKLTKNQLHALKVMFTRSIAFQYLVGACTVTKKNLDHAFAEHEEEYMAISLRGTTIGKFDPENQGFSSTPADAETAIRNIKTKMSIMSHSKENKKRAYILFICNPINIRDLYDNNRVLQRALANNNVLTKAIVYDPELGAMIEQGKIIPVPVLINEDTREVLKIADHSAYI